MKVIISHDVDHLYPSDHWFDLFFPRLWARSFVQLIRRQIGLKTFFNRLLCVFNRRLNRIPELCEFDQYNGVKSTFFFGMANALGMSYHKDKALYWIKYVKDRHFEAGVHGCDYQSMEAIKREHDDFYKLTGIKKFGIRNHYVRYDNDTFKKMSKAGYLFDSTEFNKSYAEYKDPYKIGQMWEFPLAIMDVYIYRFDVNKSKKIVEQFISQALEKGGKYLTILFHDTSFDPKCYPEQKLLYEWIVGYVKDLGMEFVSYNDAIKELEND